MNRDEWNKIFEDLINERDSLAKRIYDISEEKKRLKESKKKVLERLKAHLDIVIDGE